MDQHVYLADPLVLPLHHTLSYNLALRARYSIGGDYEKRQAFGEEAPISSQLAYSPISIIVGSHLSSQLAYAPTSIMLHIIDMIAKNLKAAPGLETRGSELAIISWAVLCTVVVSFASIKRS